jgi:hypothetical protein
MRLVSASDVIDSLPLAPRASWLWPKSVSGKNTYVEFRRCFIGAGLEEAYIQLSAETSLRLWLNGELMLSGPAREVPPYFYFDTLDLLPLVRAEENELRIVAHHQGENSQSYQAGAPAILVGGGYRYEDGENVDFAEPAGWQARRIGRYREDAHRLFSCLGFSEHVDYSLPDGEWETPSRVSFHPLEARSTALASDLPEWLETVRTVQDWLPQDSGGIADLGMEVSGYVELKLRADRPVSLQIAYGENLVDGKVDPSKGGMCYSDRLELPAGETTWRSYEKRAFRFLAIDQAVEVVSLRVIEETWPYERQWKTGEPKSSLERIFEVSARTIELNSEDLLTDCPWRERAQYMDCQHYMGAMQKLFGTLEPIRRFLRQFPRGADASGLLRMCYPSPPSTFVIPDFSISYAILLERYLSLSGDVETVRENLAVAERGVTVFRQYEDTNGLLKDVPGWIFLDNTFELPKFPRSAGLNAVYHGGYRALGRLHEICGDAEKAAGFAKTSARLREAFRLAFVRGERLLDADSTIENEAFHQWVYHYSAESGRWRGASFRMRVRFRKSAYEAKLYLSAHAGSRAWIDGKLALESLRGESWTRSAVFEREVLSWADDAEWHQLDLEVQGNGIDWECYLSSEADVEWAEAEVWEEMAFGQCRGDEDPGANVRATDLRRYVWPWMSQTSVGLAAFHGLLERAEARGMLAACLPEAFVFPFAKRTTPFFAKIGEDRTQRRILPCNVPASLYYFCHALRMHGMEEEARGALLPIYEGMLERGATTWWEEWNTRSSLCHAWASFVVEFFDMPENHENV